MDWKKKYIALFNIYLSEIIDDCEEDEAFAAEMRPLLELLYAKLSEGRSNG